MWSRVELKTQAKNLLKLNYWLFVLGAIILSFVTTGHISGSGGLKLNYNANSNNISDIRMMLEMLVHFPSHTS